MKKIIATIVYTHLWIAICAAAMVIQTGYLLTGEWAFSALAWLTFGSTLCLYAIHRLVGLQKLKDLNTALNPRYIIINRDQQMVLIFGIIGGLISAYFFFQLQPDTQRWLIFPGIISIAYVVPFLSGKRRLRDIGILKIFLIALAYALIVVQLVHMEVDVAINQDSWLLFLEKALFIFAITIPFDIRDLEVDNVSGVKTIPSILGVKKAILLSQFCLLGCIILVDACDHYAMQEVWSMLIAYVITIIYLQATRTERGDLFYAFGMDGMMVVQTVALLAVSML